MMRYITTLFVCLVAFASVSFAQKPTDHLSFLFYHTVEDRLEFTLTVQDEAENKVKVRVVVEYQNFYYFNLKALEESLENYYYHESAYGSARVNTYLEDLEDYTQAYLEELAENRRIYFEKNVQEQIKLWQEDTKTIIMTGQAPQQLRSLVLGILKRAEYPYANNKVVRVVSHFNISLR